LSRAASRKRIAFARTASRLRPQPLIADAKRARSSVADIARRARPALMRILDGHRTSLASQAKLLETLSYQATLNRGYAIVRDTDGQVLRAAKQVASAERVGVTLADGTVELQPTGTNPKATPPAVKAKPKTPPPKGDPSDQGNLF
ncbi:MAG: exodeoxyribonuclease VII large subunit, partial [Pseudomonadota bacterium]|nr:exodeoxyribonuclease VII large subunit [Pseudomonadota bacterium]